ncbi:FAD binding domain-containing protein [Microdochium trichocladiopsis]|uniref:FAD binding domain-containing protein n=1 Tax=Microdochium trichocladiopsis TaxID=1682393 RepID=A0A9P9BTP4_9PEZI|nr:FAD binding domain-containing protein [Microdochium trichocladiopsis]KAH7040196.1 FAD binding domain-containing protein [Microdochium trichocladiopsis]
MFKTDGSLKPGQDFVFTVGGRLVKVTPIGAVCHDPTYDETKCAELQASWDNVATHYESTSSLMTSYSTGETCDPFTPRESPCTMGNYSAYTIDAVTTSDIIAGLSFARATNIRLVIRNTAHDFWGRSAGHGSLAVRMARFKSYEVLPEYRGDAHYYSGPAFKMGAGLLGFEAQAALEPHGLVMVAGYCPSVGPAGGYVQGGGHSPLSGHFGMAADQTLEYEVVTAAGSLVKASRTENSDLFFALNGGGAGNWAIVVSMTVRVYPMLPMTAAQLFIPRDAVAAATATGNSTVEEEEEEDKFWAMVDKFYSLIPALTAQGVYITYAFGPQHFGFFPLSAYNRTKAEVEAMLRPFTEYLDSQGIVPALFTITESPSYSQHVAQSFAASQPTKEWPSGGRMIPTELLLDPARRAQLVAVMRRIVGAGALTSSTSVSPLDRVGNPTSLNPAWRQSSALVIMTWPWENGQKEKMRGKVDMFARELSPLLIQVAPESGSYSNEADIFMPEWQWELYGEHWERLSRIKRAWDPEGLFYSAHTPGAERYHIDDAGRLCEGAAW